MSSLIERKKGTPMLEVISFHVERGLYVVELQAVREITEIDKIHTVPKSGENMLGVVDLRGAIVPVFNLRSYLGLKTVEETNTELIELLNLREQDHRRWIAELEASVMENREFSLTTDPSACAFGKWYDNFVTHNRMLRRKLVEFDAPHKRIHGIGKTVKDLLAEGRRDSALEIIGRAKSMDLNVLIGLFETTRNLLTGSHDRLGIVLHGGGRDFVIPVDHVDQACTVQPHQLKDGFILFGEKTVGIRLSVETFARELGDVNAALSEAA
jgi:purine-binding chemotaxis protein CheW